MGWLLRILWRPSEILKCCLDVRNFWMLLWWHVGKCKNISEQWKHNFGFPHMKCAFLLPQKSDVSGGNGITPGLTVIYFKVLPSFQVGILTSWGIQLKADLKTIWNLDFTLEPAIHSRALRCILEPSIYPRIPNESLKLCCILKLFNTFIIPWYTLQPFKHSRAVNT